MQLLQQIQIGLNSEAVSRQLAQLSLRQRIAQLIHIPAWSNRSDSHLEELITQVEEYGVGGIIFFQGDPVTQGRWTAQLQKASQLPLLIGLDAEWGLGMRLRSTPTFPYQMSLGATQSNSLVYEMGKEIARQCREIGVHINFAPVVDINTHPDNPVIGFRSFGSDPTIVTAKAMAYAQGLEDGGVMPVIKHFPGHGDTAHDSHMTLPILPHDSKRLWEVELKPFQHLIEANIPAVMSCHLHVPSWDDTPNRAVTHSALIIQQQLRKALDFQGLLFTDALDMKGVSQYYTPAEINRDALLAGHDILLFCVDVEGSISAILEAVGQGLIKEEEIEKRCRKSLAFKEALGISQENPPAWDAQRAAVKSHQITVGLAEEAVSWYKEAGSLSDYVDKKGILIDMSEQKEDELGHHQLSFLGGETYVRGERLNDLLPRGLFRISRTSTAERLYIPEQESLLLVVTGLQVKAKDKFGMDMRLLNFVDRCLSERNCCLLWMGSPYGLQHLKNWKEANAILLTYQEGVAFEKVAADILLEKQSAAGTLPIRLE